MNVFRKYALSIVSLALIGCGGEGEGEPIRVNIPPGASFGQVTDSLAEHDIIGSKLLFKVYGRIKGAASSIQPGVYAFKRGTSWSDILTSLREGSLLTARIVIPEAWDLRGIAPRIAEATGLNADSILRVMADSVTAARFDVAGPTLEGYLYPATYTFPLTTPLDTI